MLPLLLAHPARRRFSRTAPPGVDLLRGVAPLPGAGEAQPVLGEDGAVVGGHDQLLHIGLQRREVGLRRKLGVEELFHADGLTTQELESVKRR